LQTFSRSTRNAHRHTNRSARCIPAPGHKSSRCYAGREEGRADSPAAAHTLSVARSTCSLFCMARERALMVRGLSRSTLRRILGSAILIFILIPVLVSGCKPSIVELRVVIDLHITVGSTTGEPLANVPIFLEDHRARRHVPRAVAPIRVCTTGRDGACSALISYGYSEPHWPWSRTKRFQDKMARQFELITERDGEFLSLGFLPIASPEQVQGQRKVIYHAQLE